jgi:hypothetical protein
VFDGKHISNFDNTSGWKTLNSMFFDAFVESKRTRNIRYQLPIRVFL